VVHAADMKTQEGQLFHTHTHIQTDTSYSGAARGKTFSSLGVKYGGKPRHIMGFVFNYVP